MYGCRPACQRSTATCGSGTVCRLKDRRWPMCSHTSATPWLTQTSFSSKFVLLLKDWSQSNCHSYNNHLNFSFTFILDFPFRFVRQGLILTTLSQVFLRGVLSLFYKFHSNKVLTFPIEFSSITCMCSSFIQVQSGWPFNHGVAASKFCLRLRAGEADARRSADLPCHIDQPAHSFR